MESHVTDLHKDLIDRCKHNDVAAQKALYQMYAKAMYNLCLRMMGNRMDAEDCMQEAFVRAFRQIHSYKAQSTFGAWLKRIIVNQCINQLKQNKRLNWQEISNEHVSNEYDSDEEVPGISSETINLAIQKLPPGSRAVFTLKMLEGYDHNEIAQILNISVSTSKSQFSRAKELLRAALTKTVQL